MSASSLPLVADSSTVEKPQTPGPTSAYSDRPLCVHHHGDVTVVVYSSPNQQPKRLNHPILPSLHIILLEEGKEIEGMCAILAGYLDEGAGSATQP